MAPPKERLVTDLNVRTPRNLGHYLRLRVSVRIVKKREPKTNLSWSNGTEQSNGRATSRETQLRSACYRWLGDKIVLPVVKRPRPVPKIKHEVGLPLVYFWGFLFPAAEPDLTLFS